MKSGVGLAYTRSAPDFNVTSVLPSNFPRLSQLTAQPRCWIGAVVISVLLVRSGAREVLKLWPGLR